MASHLNDLFDDDVGVDDDVNDVDDVGRAAMPGFDDEAEEAPMNEDAGNEDAEDGEEGEGGDVLAKLRALKRGAAKKRVVNPQPKLDATRLKSDRGLPILPKLFEGVQFKGKGHEARDLKLMMGKLEHWGHRLFPKLTFDELIARLEKLGGKKDVQTCVKRMRLDMPVLDEDFTSAALYTSDNDEPPPPSNHEADDFDAEEAYDEMIRQEREAMERRKQQEREEEEDMEQDAVTSQDPTAQTPLRGTTQNAVNITDGGLTSTPTTNQTTSQSTPQSTPTTNQTTSQSTPQGLTPEQKERLAINKRRALEKRAARLGVPVASLLPQTPKENSNEDAVKTPSSVSDPDQNSSKPAAKDTQPNTENDDVMQTEEDVMKAIDFEEGISSKHTSQEIENYGVVNNTEASLNLKLSESEGVGTLRMNESNMETQEEGTLRLNASEHTENDDVGHLRLSTTEDSLVTQDAKSETNYATAKCSNETGTHEIRASSEKIGTLKLSETQDNSKNIDSMKIAPSANNCVDNDDINLEKAKKGEDVEKLNSSLVGSGGEEEQGLCLQLSDSTNTTQEEDDIDQ